MVWNGLDSRPMLRYNDHSAAVKAITWSPHQRGLLASGGGTADRHIRFWNTTSNACLQATDTGSQVCNLAWSISVNELVRTTNTLTYRPTCKIKLSALTPYCPQVSTHGYSQNQVAIWSYPSMAQIATLTVHHASIQRDCNSRQPLSSSTKGHSTRVLYLAMSPDGQTAVTGAGDESLRFWNVFPPTRGTVTHH